MGNILSTSPPAIMMIGAITSFSSFRSSDLSQFILKFFHLRICWRVSGAMPLAVILRKVRFAKLDSLCKSVTHAA